jgi:hypothetical protein
MWRPTFSRRRFSVSALAAVADYFSALGYWMPTGTHNLQSAKEGIGDCELGPGVFYWRGELAFPYQGSARGPFPNRCSAEIECRDYRHYSLPSSASYFWP